MYCATPVIHASAVVHSGAQIDPTVSIGAYSIIGENVVIGRGTSIASHVVIDAHTQIGEDNIIHSFNSIGGPPQDKKYSGEPTALVIGDRNTIREFCTFNRGTSQDAGLPMTARLATTPSSRITRRLQATFTLGTTPFWEVLPLCISLFP